MLRLPAGWFRPSENTNPSCVGTFFESSSKHLALERVGYPRHRSTLEEEMVKLERIAARSKLQNWEVKLLLGMLKQINYRLDNPQ